MSKISLDIFRSLCETLNMSAKKQRRQHILQHQRRAHRRVHTQIARSRPEFELNDPTVPYLRTVDSAAESFTTQHLIIREADGRRVAI